MEKKLYNSCDELPIYNFYKAVFFNELNYLVKDGEATDDELKKLLTKIIKEANVLSGDKKLLSLLKNRFILFELQFKYKSIISVLKMFNISKNKDILNVTIDLGFKYDGDNSLDVSIKSLINQAKLLKNKINLQEIKVNKLNNSVDESGYDIMLSLDKEALLFETFLELGYFVDKKKVNVTKWLLMRNMVKAKKEQLEKI